MYFNNTPSAPEKSTLFEKSLLRFYDFALTDITLRILIIIKHTTTGKMLIEALNKLKGSK